MKLFIASVAIATLALHFGIYAFTKADSLQMQLNIAQQKEKIDNDQIRDLLYQTKDQEREKDSAKAQGYLAGIMEGIIRKDYWSQVWHEGYNRGSEVREQIAESFLRNNTKIIEAGSKK